MQSVMETGPVAVAGFAGNRLWGNEAQGGIWAIQIKTQPREGFSHRLERLLWGTSHFERLMFLPFQTEFSKF